MVATYTTVSVQPSLLFCSQCRCEPEHRGVDVVCSICGLSKNYEQAMREAHIYEIRNQQARTSFRETMSGMVHVIPPIPVNKPDFVLA